MKPLRIMPKIDEENGGKGAVAEEVLTKEQHEKEVIKNGDRLKNGNKEIYDASVKVIVHKAENKDEKEKQAEKQDQESVHVNTLQMSPVLSSRRGK